MMLVFKGEYRWLEKGYYEEGRKAIGKCGKIGGCPNLLDPQKKPSVDIILNENFGNSSKQIPPEQLCVVTSRMSCHQTMTSCLSR